MVGSSSSDSPDARGDQLGSGWQFVTNHTQVLLCIADNPEMRLRDIADTVGITVGSAQRILSDLVVSGYVTRERHGRRNRYIIPLQAPMLRRAAREGYDLGAVLNVLRLVNAPPSSI